MELRKNPKKDIHRYSQLIFQLSLIFLLILTNMAFEMKVWDTPGIIDSFELDSSPQPLLPHQENASEKLPPPHSPSSEENKEVFPTDSTEKNEEEDEPMIRLKLDAMLEGEGFDNSFLDKMTDLLARS